MLVGKKDEVSDFERVRETALIGSGGGLVLGGSYFIANNTVDVLEFFCLEMVVTAHVDIKKGDRMTASVELEWSVAGGGVDGVVNTMFDKEEVLFPVVLVEVNEVAKGRFNKIVLNF